MTVFEAVRENVTARMAAEALGLQISRNGMACCPFHDDRHPSMKLDERYYCFGCQSHGDAIDFAANYLKVDKLEAATRLAGIFNLPYDKPGHRHKPKKADMLSETRQAFGIWRKLALDVLARYERHIAEQKERHAPQPEDEEWPETFIQALKEQDTIACFRDVLQNGSLATQIVLYENERERIREFEKRMEGNPTGEDHRAAPVSDAGDLAQGRAGIPRVVQRQEDQRGHVLRRIPEPASDAVRERHPL